MEIALEDRETLEYGSIAERFVCEPRASTRGGWSAICWVIVKDTFTDKYITYPNRPKKYAEFRNSKEAYEWIREQIKEGGITV